jgi:hypothetical protein
LTLSTFFLSALSLADFSSEAFLAATLDSVSFLFFAAKASDSVLA